MKHILEKRILPLLGVGLLLCTPHTIAYATADGIESRIAQTEEATPPMDMVPPTGMVLPTGMVPPTETVPLEQTTPKKPPTEENTEQTSGSVKVTWESLEFEYSPHWNADEHCYDKWESTKNPITVTNTTKNGAPVRVTLTFVPVEGMGATAVFAPCENDPKPDDFTFAGGQVTFQLPRDADREGKATVNLYLTGEPMGWETQQYNRIGSIKTEITPLLEPTPLPESEKKPTEPSQPAQTEPSQSDPLPAEPSQPESLPAQPSQKELLPAEPSQPETFPAQPSQSEQLQPPKQNSKEETQTAPHTELGAPPQEEPR